MDDIRDIARNERAIPRRLVQHLFTRLPLDQAEAAVNRVVDAALPGPVAWYTKHVRELLARLGQALIAGDENVHDCGCMPDAPAITCNVGQSLFRVQANHIARRSA